MTLTGEFKEYLISLELCKTGKATSQDYVTELNKRYDDVDQKLDGLIVKLGAGIFIALVFKAEKREEFIQTHGMKYTHIKKTYVIDVLWGQPIKLVQVASTSELRKKSTERERPSFL